MGRGIPAEVEEVMDAYDWGRVHHVQQNQNAWFVSAEKGRFFLKQSQVSAEPLTQLLELLAAIRKAGFMNLLPFVHTKDGKRLVTNAAGQWYATPWKETSQKEMNPNILAGSLARFHRQSEPLVEKYFTSPEIVDQQWLDQWEAKKEKVASIHQEIAHKEFPSPFERSLLKQFDLLDRSFHFAIRGMEKFIQLEDGRSPRYTLCHNRIHPSNLIYEQEDFYWIDFDHASLDTPARDLAMLIHRFSGDDCKPHELLASYQQEYPLQPKEKRLLALYLAYPESVLKQIDRYVEGIQVSQEPDSQRRLDKELQKLLAIQQFVVQLWPNKKGIKK